jgi:hypothetical protein
MKYDEEHLTIEGLSTLYDNRFELVNRAINLAVDKIHSGRGPRVNINCNNTSTIVLAEMRAGQDYLDLIEDDEEQEVDSSQGKELFRAND